MRTCRSLAGAVPAAILLAVFVFMGTVSTAAEVPRMTIDDLKGVLGDPGVVVLDVRTEKDWETASDKIRGAVRKNPKEVAGWSGDLDETKTYVLYCA